MALSMATSVETEEYIVLEKIGRIDDDYPFFTIANSFQGTGRSELLKRSCASQIIL